MPIIKANITQQVTDYLKENLENGVWSIGEKIPSENELTQLLGVSRASVRMAIQQLIGIGALESAHGKGTFVRNNNISGLMKGLSHVTEEDYKDINKVLQFREVLETGTSSLAAQSATKEQLARLEELLEKMKASVGNPKAFVRFDMDFHMEICKAAGNQLLEKSLTEVFEQKAHNHEQMNEVFGYEDGIHFHTLILKAIREHDAKKAEQHMREHMQKAQRDIQVKE